MLTGAHITAALTAIPGAVGRQYASPEAIAEQFNAAMAHVPDAFRTETRIKAVLASCFMESWFFRATEEIDWANGRSPVSQLAYPKPAGWDYGGLKARTYFPWIGRTLIQITWQSNYRSFGAWLYKLGLAPSPDVFITDPASLADPKWAALGPVWYVTQVPIESKTSLEWVDLDDDPCFAISCCVNLGRAPLSARVMGKQPADMVMRRAAWDAWDKAAPILPPPTPPAPQPEPTPEPTPLPEGVLKYRAALRYAPSVLSRPLRRLAAGTRVQLLGPVVGRWARVWVPVLSKQGWVYQPFIVSK